VKKSGNTIRNLYSQKNLNFQKIY